MGRSTVSEIVPKTFEVQPAIGKVTNYSLYVPAHVGPVFAVQHGERDDDLDQSYNINWKSDYETRTIRFKAPNLMSSRQ